MTTPTTLSNYQTQYQALSTQMPAPLTIGENLAQMNGDGSVTINFKTNSIPDIQQLQAWLNALVPAS